MKDHVDVANGTHEDDTAPVTPATAAAAPATAAAAPAPVTAPMMAAAAPASPAAPASASHVRPPTGPAALATVPEEDESDLRDAPLWPWGRPAAAAGGFHPAAAAEIPTEKHAENCAIAPVHGGGPLGDSQAAQAPSCS